MIGTCIPTNLRQDRNSRCSTTGAMEHVVAVSIETHAPEALASHELLSLLKLAISTENGVYKFMSTVLPYGHRLLLAILLLGSLPHVVLADLEKLGEADQKALAALEEIFNHLVALLLANLGHSLFSPLDFASDLDEKEPELTSHLGKRGDRTVVEDGSVVDPLAEGVRVEYGPEEHDGFFAGVPVLVRVAGRNTSAVCSLLLATCTLFLSHTDVRCAPLAV
jgi:hypothetical protein